MTGRSDPRFWESMRSNGMLNENSTNLSEMTGVENRDKLVSFCNSGVCIGTVLSNRGRAVGMGNMKKCPLCKGPIRYSTRCSPREIEKFKLKYGKEFKS